MIIYQEGESACVRAGEKEKSNKLFKQILNDICKYYITNCNHTTLIK